MTEMKPIGSAADVQNVNPYTEGYMGDLAKMIQGLQGAADPMSAFMGALPGLFGAAIGGTNPYTEAVGKYREAAMQRVKENSLMPWSDAFYSSGSRDAYTQALGEFETGLGKDVMGMQTGMAQGLAGMGAGLLGQQTGLLSNLMGVQGQLSAPEWWQPTYKEQNTGLGNFMEALGPIAGIASMFIPGMQGVGLGLLGSSLTNLFRNTGSNPQAASDRFQYGYGAGVPLFPGANWQM